MNYFTLIILTINLLWFGAAFHLFSIKSNSAAKMLLAPENRIPPYNSIVAQLFKFLGGFNLSLMILCLIAIYKHELIINHNMMSALCFVFFIAHGSQFWFNLPLAVKERNNEQPIWPVLRGRMYFIFRIDFLLAICNLIFCIYLFIF